MNKKKILFVLPSLTMTNGVAKFMYNYLSNMDLDLFNITILTSNLRPSEMYVNFYKSNNIDVYYTDLVKNVGFIRWHKQLKSFFKSHHDFDLIYSNVANQSYFIYKEAKRYGIKKTALHAHATVASDNKIKNFINKVLTKKASKFLTYRFACSEAAGRFVFGNNKFTVINNAIDYALYKYNENFREDIRRKYSVETKKIIGFVGRFTQQKNVYFFYELSKLLSDDFVIMMIGEGKQKEDFVNKISIEGLKEKFIFINETSDVYKYYSAFDYFLLPSLFEGLPVVGIEAQINGLLCIFSTNITKEVDISSRTYFLSNEDLLSWKECLLDYDRNNYILNENFDIKVQAHKFSLILERL